MSRRTLILIVVVWILLSVYNYFYVNFFLLAFVWMGLSLALSQPSAIEQAFAIYVNVIQLDDNGKVLNAKYAEKRATDYLRAYFDPNFEVKPAYEDWEIALHAPPPSRDLI